MKYVHELSDYIKNKMGTSRSPAEDELSRAELAQEISQNSDMAFLLLAKSGFTHDEKIIFQKVNEIMYARETKILSLDPESLRGSDFEPIATPEQEQAIQDLYKNNPSLNTNLAATRISFWDGVGFHNGFDLEAAWIQTYSGRRFNPTNPNSEAIVIQDIAHALSMQCRFSGHCREFYSVAQHSVLVSHICNFEDALWGLLHDASEAYLVDVPRPLKRSGKFQAYLDFEDQMQKAICQRFNLSGKEPPSVKKADTILLATEARDLMSPRHPDWKQPIEPLPFKIESWNPKEAETQFLDRFKILIQQPI